MYRETKVTPKTRSIEVEVNPAYQNAQRSESESQDQTTEVNLAYQNAQRSESESQVQIHRSKPSVPKCTEKPK